MDCPSIATQNPFPFPFQFPLFCSSPLKERVADADVGGYCMLSSRQRGYYIHWVCNDYCLEDLQGIQFCILGCYFPEVILFYISAAWWKTIRCWKFRKAFNLLSFMIHLPVRDFSDSEGLSAAGCISLALQKFRDRLAVSLVLSV
ncbi:hypothetical protein Dimus_028256 [Dionaea muscipula]